MIISRFVLFETKKIRIFVRKRLCFKKKVLLTFAGSNYYQIIKKENYVRHCIKS